MASTTSSGEKCFVSNQHGRRVVSGFERLWRSYQMCDTILLAEDRHFPVHRSYLAACSLYFHAMFAEDFQESKQNHIELKGVTAAGLQVLIEYAYTGCVVITPCNLQNVLEAAAHLQFHDVMDFAAQYIRERLTIDNCLEFFNMAEMYELGSCQKDIKRFVLENFVDVASNESFVEIGLDLILELLADDRLHASSELDVFNISLQWLEYSPDRLDFAKKVLELIRYGLMSTEEMETVYSNHIMMTEQCQSVLYAALNYHMHLFLQPIIETSISCMRSYTESMVIFGAGKTNNSLCKNILATRLGERSLQKFVPLSQIKNPRYFSAIAVLNNFLFVVGGQVAMAGDGTHATNTAFRYNARDGRWLQLSSMMVPRTYFALVPVNDGLIAVAGKHNRIALNSVEKYKFKSNEWVQISNLPNTLFSHAGCANENKVYISGGCPGENFTSQVHCYDSEKDGWKRCSPMLSPRGYHVMFSHKNCIYVCAGNNNAGSRADVADVECYNINTDQWTLMSSCSYGQSEAPSLMWNNKLFILGGYSWNQHSFQDIIQCYDVVLDSWEVLDLKLPEPMTGVMACHIQLPKKLYESHIGSS